jgi:hypothetical protein
MNLINLFGVLVGLIFLLLVVARRDLPHRLLIASGGLFLVVGGVLAGF